jgi:hypothetical protein
MKNKENNIGRREIYLIDRGKEMDVELQRREIACNRDWYMPDLDEVRKYKRAMNMSIL